MSRHRTYSYSLLGAKITGCLCIFWFGLQLKISHVIAPSDQINIVSTPPPTSALENTSHAIPPVNVTSNTTATTTQQQYIEYTLTKEADNNNTTPPTNNELPTEYRETENINISTTDTTNTLPSSLIPLDIAPGISEMQKAIIIPIINDLVQRYDEHLTTDRKLSQQLEKIIINAESSTVQRCLPTHVRGCSSHSIIELNISQIGNNTELREVLAHEMAHIIDLGIIVGSASEKSSFTEFNKQTFASDDPSLQFYQLCRSNEKIRKPDCGELSFVGGYAMTNAFEDRAETVNMYLHHHSYLQAMARTDPILAKKVAIIYRLFGGQYMTEHPISDRSATERRRDSTQL